MGQGGHFVSGQPRRAAFDGGDFKFDTVGMGAFISEKVPHYLFIHLITSK
ncbi:hypothetical protein [Agrilactobacillus composti]|nr:hypothetical protein [Agrilactobacillus composti]